MAFWPLLTHGTCVAKENHPPWLLQQTWFCLTKSWHWRYLKSYKEQDKCVDVPIKIKRCWLVIILIWALSTLLTLDSVYFVISIYQTVPSKIINQKSFVSINFTSGGGSLTANAFSLREVSSPTQGFVWIPCVWLCFLECHKWTRISEAVSWTQSTVPSGFTWLLCKSATFEQFARCTNIF